MLDEREGGEGLALRIECRTTGNTEKSTFHTDGKGMDRLLKWNMRNVKKFHTNAQVPTLSDNETAVDAWNRSEWQLPFSARA